MVTLPVSTSYVANYSWRCFEFSSCSTHSTALLARVSHATFWINGEEFRKIKIVCLYLSRRGVALLLAPYILESRELAQPLPLLLFTETPPHPCFEGPVLEIC